MYFKGEKALNRLLTHKYRKAEVELEKWDQRHQIHSEQEYQIITLTPPPPNQVSTTASTTTALRAATRRNP